jgi:hypothetical protein
MGVHDAWMTPMDKKPTPPPHHRAYPRSHPLPKRASAAPPPAPTRSATGSGWSRVVPEGRRFPRS